MFGLREDRVVSDLVPPQEIEEIVGISRHLWLHYGRASSAEQTMYVLHSKLCLHHTPDLRECRFSRALDRGINPEAWVGHEDKPVELRVWEGRLIPMFQEEG